MKPITKPKLPEKPNLHPRNPHRFRYDFPQLIEAIPELKNFVSINKYNSESIDFSNPYAVKMLNKAILKHFYTILLWDIPKNYLCPPIPGRADYIHYVADLLASFNDNIIPQGKSVKVLDVGVGANCVYPIIGSQAYGWHFVGSDIDPLAFKSAKNIVVSNAVLSGKIECRLQANPSNIFKEIIQVDEFFDVTICNPPFHSSLTETLAGNERKSRNLGVKSKLNFGGQNNELWCDGGEEAFIKKMIEESIFFQNQCFWFTSLVSKKEHLPNIYHALRRAKVVDIKTIEMAQGQKISRIVAWTFLNETQQNEWKMKR